MGKIRCAVLLVVGLLGGCSSADFTLAGASYDGSSEDASSLDGADSAEVDSAEVDSAEVDSAEADSAAVESAVVDTAVDTAIDTAADTAVDGTADDTAGDTAVDSAVMDSAPIDSAPIDSAADASLDGPPPCSATSPGGVCPSGQVCVGGDCLKTCVDRMDCSSEVCGRVVDAEGNPGSVSVCQPYDGKAYHGCIGGLSCEAGYCCATVGPYTNNLCVKGCQASSDCGSRSCTPRTGLLCPAATGFCL